MPIEDAMLTAMLRRIQRLEIRVSDLRRNQYILVFLLACLAVPFFLPAAALAVPFCLMAAVIDWALRRKRHRTRKDQEDAIHSAGSAR